MKKDSLHFKMTPLTIAILSKVTKEGEVNTFIMEGMRDYVVPSDQIQGINYACKNDGSILKDMIKGGKDQGQITHKSPIAIDPSTDMYSFPITSSTSKRCSWIAHSHVKYKKQ